MPKTKFEINKEIVFSTAHITLECSVMLGTEAIASSSPTLGFIVYEYEYGYRVYLNLQEPTPTTEFPELNSLMAYAKLNKCKWLVLDRDRQEYDGIETFNW